MEISESLLTAREKTVWRLKALAARHGYAQYPMRRFEEYALYQENKSFLRNGQVLAFPTPDGRLMALRPDVTLSLVKHSRATRHSVEKLYYTESVYRIEAGSHELKQIDQMGVEYLGAVDEYATLEVLRLALECLKTVRERVVLELGHMGFIGGLMKLAALEGETQGEVFALIRQKNSHELRAVLDKTPLSQAMREMIAQLPHLAGPAAEVLPRARQMCVAPGMEEALRELSAQVALLEKLGYGEDVRLDFSILNDLDYYNGLVFRGYVEGAPRAALSGGRYDNLMRRMEKSGDGIGFALYLDAVARLIGGDDCDIDVLVLYAPGDDPAAVSEAVEQLSAQGLRVLAAGASAVGRQAGKTLRFTQNGLKEVRARA